MPGHGLQGARHSAYRAGTEVARRLASSQTPPVSTTERVVPKKRIQALCPNCGHPKHDPERQEGIVANLPERGYVRLKLLIQLVPFSQATLWRRVADGGFPKPKKLSDRVTAWRVDEVRQWLAAQKAVDA